VLVATVAAGLLGFAPARHAFADEFIDRVNALFKTIAPNKRSDTVLLPLLSKLTEPPAPLRNADVAALLPADAPAFAAATKWAQEEPQVKALEGLKKVTDADPKGDWRKAFAWGQPYGLADVDPDYVDMKAYTDLGEPPTLAAARVLYMPMLERYEILAQVEATRLASEGKLQDAIDLLVRFAHFSRQIADRQFRVEQVFAFKAMIRALERVRDLLYAELRAGTESKVTPDFLRDQIERLRDRGGIMGIDRLALPSAEKQGALQIVGRIFDGNGGPGPEFARRMARLSARERPLRIFSEISAWESISAVHGNGRETRDRAENVYNDWAKRWELPKTDPSLKLPTDYTKLDKVKYAALDTLLGNLGVLFELRNQLEVELNGTRMSMACYAFWLRDKNFPPALTAVAPAIIRTADPDPFSRERQIFRYFVPMRDNRVTGQDPKPHRLTLFPEYGERGIEKLFDKSTFVLYSLGPDGSNNNILRATQMVEDERGDYLVFPPAVSIIRDFAIETGKAF
jgi:hypothetical protein